METVQRVWDYLIGVQFHPFVTIVVFLIISVGKLRWETPYIDLAKDLIDKAAVASPKDAAQLMIDKKAAQIKADKIESHVMLAGFLTSVAGEISFYWPVTLHAVVICIFMGVAQIGAAWIIYFYVDKWGLADNIGGFIKKKLPK